MKFGFSGEWASKTEPQSNNYMGNYNFGHDAQNPLSTGNGYANALLGVFTTYTELTNRVDRDRRHWQTEGYAQDSWRLHSAADARLRRAVHAQRRVLRHAEVDGGLLRARLESRERAAAVLRRSARRACPATRRARRTTSVRYDPRNPTVLLPSAFIGNLVPGTGSQINGMVADGYPGMRPGEYFNYAPLVAAPRLGFAWDINGDGKQALRASAESSMRFPRAVHGKASSAIRRRRSAAWSSGRVSATSRTSRTRTSRSSRRRSRWSTPAAKQRSLEKSYNVNVTYQRDIGFSTTAEVAYVGAFTYAGGRTEDINRPVNNLYLLADPSRMFNGNALATNFLRTNYPGVGSDHQMDRQAR